MEKTAAEFNVKGLVQGVGFRYFVYREAIKLGLKGYAKNLYDGSVEVLAEGSEESINKLFKLLKLGPSRSMVGSVEINFIEYTGKYSGFDIR